MSSANGCHPPATFQRKQHAATAAVGRLAEGHDAFPVGRTVVRDGIDTGGIAEIDPDSALLGQREADRFQQTESGCATAGGIYDEICPNDLALAVAVLVTHAGHGLTVCRPQDLLH